jgi:nitric oxide reductase subunit B
VRAGLLGFVINPPASLYYVQGPNLTPAQGHAALFGVYGMLGIGLMPFCLRGLYARQWHADVHSKVMEMLVWLRVQGDVVFAAGSVFLAIHAWKLLCDGPRVERELEGVLQPA